MNRLFKRRLGLEAARLLFDRVVEQARRPHFYAVLGVPDTVDGRFDLIALHVWLVQRRLKAVAPDAETTAEQVGQQLAEVFFYDMDLSLREMGASDIGVGRRVKRMIEGFVGRAQAYDEAFAAGPEAALPAVLTRNLYSGQTPAPGQMAAMTAYLGAAAAALEAEPDSAPLTGRIVFPTPPALAP